MNEGTIVQRLGRTAIGILLFIGISFVLKKIAEVAGVEGEVISDFFRNMLSGLVLFWLAGELAIKLGWYYRKERKKA